MTRKIIPFSHLALGGKFRYIASIGPNNTPGKVYVKIGNGPKSGCIAEWNDSLVTSKWVGQGIYSLNNSGKDIDIEVVE